jgi:hypothetical protein
VPAVTVDQLIAVMVALATVLGAAAAVLIALNAVLARIDRRER